MTQAEDRRRDEEPRPEENGFEAVLDRDPIGSRLLDLLEGWMALVGASSTAATMAFWDLELSTGWLVGWLTFQFNIAVVRRLMRVVLAGGTHHRLATVALSLKMLVLLGMIWGALRFLPISPVGFLLGFTTVLTGLVIGSVVWAPRQGDRGAEQQRSTLPTPGRDATQKTPRRPAHNQAALASLAQDG